MLNWCLFSGGNLFKEANKDKLYHNTAYNFHHISEAYKIKWHNQFGFLNIINVERGALTFGWKEMILQTLLFLTCYNNIMQFLPFCDSNRLLWMTHNSKFKPGISFSLSPLAELG